MPFRCYFIASVSVLCAEESPKEKEPQRVIELRKQYEVARGAALTPVLTKYQKDLEALGKQLEQHGALNAVLAVKQESALVAEELSVLAMGTIMKWKPTVLKYKPTDGWIDTGIKITKGQRITIKAQGKISPEGGRTLCDANGIKRDAWIPFTYMKKVNVACLLAYLSDAEKAYYDIGTFKAFVAKDGGRLFIGGNDATFQDNVGELEITITY